MGLLNPVDNEFIERLAVSEDDIQDISTGTQPNFIDWLEYNPINLTYDSANIVLMSNDLAAQIKLGDRVRILQSDSVDYKYFFIIDNTTPGQITIEGGNNYTFTNTTIEEFGISSVPNPLGFPGMREFVKDANPIATGATIVGTGATDAYFFMNGSFVQTYWILDLTLGVFESTIAIGVDLPVPGLGDINTIGLYVFPGGGTSARANPSPYTTGDIELATTMTASPPFYPLIPFDLYHWPDQATITFIGSDIGNIINGPGTETVRAGFTYDIAFGL